MRVPPLAYVERLRERPVFDSYGFLLYFGALLAAVSTAWVIGELWRSQGDGAMFGFTTLALAASVALPVPLLRAGRHAAGALLVFIAVTVVPLWVYAFERWIDVWPRQDPGEVGFFHTTIQAGWVAMEIVTALAALAALYLTRFPFLVAPLGFVLWYFSMDLAPLFFGTSPSNDERAWVAIAVGLLMIAASALAEQRGLRPYGFWGHLFGLLSFAGGLFWLWSDSDAGWVGIALVALGALPVGLVFRRPAYAVFTAIGLVGAAEHFIDKWLEGPPSAFTLFIVGVPEEDRWEAALAFVGVGLALMSLALATSIWGERWRAWIVSRAGTVAGRRPL
jgi:hypothetical protein